MRHYNFGDPTFPKLGSSRGVSFFRLSLLGPLESARTENSFQGSGALPDLLDLKGVNYDLTFHFRSRSDWHICLLTGEAVWQVQVDEPSLHQVLFGVVQTIISHKFATRYDGIVVHHDILSLHANAYDPRMGFG